MAERPLIDVEQRLVAGREYLSALRRLGFAPDAMLWAAVGSDSGQAEMELLIVSSWADNIGPRAIYHLLFEAYDASATPREIDPFVVSLFSPRSRLAADLDNELHALRERGLLDHRGAIMSLSGGDYFTRPKWILSRRKTPSKHFDDVRRFAAFQNNVVKSAA